MRHGTTACGPLPTHVHALARHVPCCATHHLHHPRALHLGLCSACCADLCWPQTTTWPSATLARPSSTTPTMRQRARSSTRCGKKGGGIWLPASPRFLIPHLRVCIPKSSARACHRLLCAHVQGGGWGPAGVAACTARRRQSTHARTQFACFVQAGAGRWEARTEACSPVVHDGGAHALQAAAPAPGLGPGAGLLCDGQLGRSHLP